MMVLTVLFGLALAQGVISLLQGLASAKHIKTYRPQASWSPRVLLVCPCTGVDDQFVPNVKSILSQSADNVRVVFVVASEADPAFRELRALSAEVLVAGPSEGRGQKVHNLICAVERAGRSAEVLAFCDVDARFSAGWVRDLIAPLENGSVGAATGYRWYAAESGSFPSLVRSMWNASAVTMLGPHDRNFVWGGSMAITRATFDAVGIRAAWDGAVSDDYAVTLAMRKAGKRIVFVPQCLVPSYGECTWSELLEFTTRQLVITRVYEPRLWRTAFFSQTLFNAAFWLSLFFSWPVCFALYFLASLKSLIRYQAVEKVLPDGALSKRQASYILFSPLIALLYQYNLIRSALTRNILWRQIHYSLISPTETVVRRCAGGSSTP